MYTKIIILFSMMCLYGYTSAQIQFDQDVDMMQNDIYDIDQLAIGSDSISAQAALQINSKKGFILPRLSFDEIDALNPPFTPGFQVFNTDTRCVMTWNGYEWITQCAEGGSGGGINPNELDIESTGGFSYQIARDIAIDNNMNYALYVAYHDSTDVNNDGIIDAYETSSDDLLVVMNQDDSILWQLDLYGQLSSGFSLNFDNNQNLFLTLSFYNGIDLDDDNIDDIDSYGSSDIAIVKYSSTGSLLWFNRIGSSFSEEINNHNSIVDDNGDLIITGSFRGSVDFDNDGVFDKTAIGGYDGFVAKYDGSNGDLIWVQIIGNNGSDQMHSVLIDDNNDIFSVGAFWNQCDFDQDGVSDLTGFSDGLFVAKYNGTNGSLESVHGYSVIGNFRVVRAYFANDMIHFGATGIGGLDLNQDNIADFKSVTFETQVYYLTSDLNGNLIFIDQYGGYNQDDLIDFYGDDEKAFFSVEFEARTEVGRYKFDQGYYAYGEKMMLFEVEAGTGSVNWVLPIYGELSSRSQAENIDYKNKKLMALATNYGDKILTIPGGPSVQGSPDGSTDFIIIKY